MADHKLHERIKAALPSTITLDAIPENFASAQEQIRNFLDSFPCSMRTLLELDMLIHLLMMRINYLIRIMSGLIKE